MGAMASPTGSLLRASQIAREIGALPSTIKHYRRIGLLSPVAATPGGYHLFDPTALSTAREIRRLQRDERLSLEEIAARLVGDR
jgi:DNA-binding transcriptional MerR regulator